MKGLNSLTIFDIAILILFWEKVRGAEWSALWIPAPMVLEIVISIAIEAIGKSKKKS